jgi:hypothetical protein
MSETADPETPTTGDTTGSTLATITTSTVTLTTELVTDAIDDPPVPDAGWDYADLGVYVRDRLRDSEAFDQQALALVRRSAVQVWYAGAALAIVQKRETKEKGWTAWCRMHGFNLDTCYQAIRLFQRSGSVENVRALTITDARTKYSTARSLNAPHKPQTPKNPTGLPPTITSTTPAIEDPTPAPGTGSTPVTEDPVGASGGEIRGERTIGTWGRFRETLEGLTDAVKALSGDDNASHDDGDREAMASRIDAAIEALRKAKKQILPARKQTRKGSAAGA